MQPKWIVFPLFLFLFAPCTGFAEEAATTARFDARLAEAQAALEAGEPQLAESHFRTARLEGWDLLGLLAVAEGDLEKARSAFETSARAAVVGVHRPQVHLALLHQEAGEEIEALNELRVLSERFRILPEPWQQLLPLLIHTDREDEAREKLQDLHGLQPQLAASMEERLGDFEPKNVATPRIDLGSLADLNRRDRKKLRRQIEGNLSEVDRQLLSLKESPPQSDALLKLVESMREEHIEVVLELENGRIENAFSQLRRMQKQQAGGPEVLELLGFVQRAQGGSVTILLQLAEITQRSSPKQPVALLAQAYERAPSSEEVLLAYGRASLEADLPSVARTALEPLAGIYSETSEYHLLHGQSLLLLGENTDAVTAFQQAVRKDPASFAALSALGVALNGEKRYAEARETLQQALKMHPEDLDTLAALAEAEEGLGDLESAEQRALALLEQDSEHDGANFVLGMVRMKENRYDEAQTYLAGVVERNPRSAKAHYQLSLAYMRLGDREKAQHHLERYKKVRQPEMELMTAVSRSAKALQKKKQGEKNQ